MISWLVAAAYVAMVCLVARVAARRSNNDTFYNGERRSPWWAVAFGMLGTSLSGVSFVSVPGMVHQAGMTYLQMCLGFVPGYIAVALILLPVYYRLRLTTIYTFLLHRFGLTAYRTGAVCFLISKFTGAAVRLFLVCAVVHTMAFPQAPFAITALLTVAFIWLYTRRGGIGSLVWTDCVQTAAILASLVCILIAVVRGLGWSATEALQAVGDSTMSQIFVFDDWTSPRHFLKMFLSGAFIVVVMTGLDQDMMQKNLTCRTLRQAQRNMIVNGLLYLPVNMLLLGLGVLLYIFVAARGIGMPATPDDLLPAIVGGGYLGTAAQTCFTLGIAAAALSSADSALTALTTSVCVDIWRCPDDERLRRRTHLCVAATLLLMVLAFRAVGTGSVINAVYVLASYTYGPLLGLFGLGLTTRHVRPHAAAVPIVCMFAPLTCLCLSWLTSTLWGYHFGYELLLLNGLLTAIGLWMCAERRALHS